MSDKTAKGAGKGSRLDRFIETQQTAIDHVSSFAENVANMTIRGELSPTVWIKESAKMWSNLAKDLGEMTKIVLKD